MNPFDIKNSSATSKIEDQINELEVGCSKKIELFGLSNKSARGCMSNKARHMKKKFKTKMPNGELWVLRVF